VNNLNDVAETAKKGKGKKGGYGKASVKMPEIDSDVGAKLGSYAEKQVEKVKNASKKVKTNIEIE